ncbi:BnaA09g06700D [Brassica napus]|uniref:BnaA09g06700D protein n=1 Tax=Brassica napus TaxID=3708 RepID=A0A078FWB1_BRANA|nr:BnaA09g06700D [Brassica napus]
MDFSVKPNGGSPSPSSSTTPHRLKPAAATASDRDPMHSWWESVSKQRSRILSLSSLLSSGDEAPISSLADSDRPALSLLSSRPAYSLISASLRDPSSGSGSDPLCQWLYETYLSSDQPLRLVVLSFLPLLAGTYLSRIHSSDSSSLPSLSGFEAVLLAIYAAEVKSRAGKAVLVHIPDLSQPSLYHTPRNGGVDRSRDSSNHVASVGVLSPQLEPQVAVKSTKRAGIVGVGMQCYFKEISQMPAWSKLELCSFAGAWAGQDCDCKEKIDGEGDKQVIISSNGVGGGGVRIPLPWELLQPILRILGHCLLSPLNSEDVKDAASNAVRSLYARASHDLNPQAILATRSLVNLDASARAAAKTASAESVDGLSNVNTPSKSKKPEILLSSK